MFGINSKGLKSGLRLGIAAAALASVVTISTGIAQTKKLTFVAWGGSTQEAEAKAFGEPFTAETGVEVVSDGPTDYGKLKAMVEAGKVEWDVVDVEGDFALRAGAQGLLEKLDFSVIDKTDLDPRFVNEYAVGSFFYAFVIGYNKDMLGDKVPTGWADFFDIEKFPGKRSIISWPVGILEMALLADGVPADKIYPLDLDRAFKKLDTIKEHIIFWNSGSEQQQLLASGQTSMCFCWDPRVAFMQKDGLPIGKVWAQNITSADFLVIPKGSPNKDLAMKFIAKAVSPEAQANLSRETRSSPINLKSAALLEKEIVDDLASTHSEGSVEIDLPWWVEHSDEVYARWGKWKAQ
jgi:putative spermidine/putrescine transport system substrate-binding protein